MPPRLVQIIAIVLAAGLLLAAARFGPPINEERRSLNMLGAADPAATAPPDYAFAVQAFGAFRSLLTNIAFIRAEQFKEQGRYYDAMQLAQWICTLQPRFPSVWEFNAWNLAWNISVTTHTPEERWNWVYSGAKLLRDEGIPKNPRAINLYKQLAWIFVNKMSETTDEYHLYYKRNWAYRMHLLLGPPPDPLGESQSEKPVAMPGLGIGLSDDELAASVRRAKIRAALDKGQAPPPELLVEPNAPAVDPNAPPDPAEVAKRAAYDYYKSIAAAPDKLSELFAQVPATREMVEKLAEMGVRINDDTLSEDNFWTDQGLSNTFFKRWRQLADRPSLLKRVLKDEERAKLEKTLDPNLAEFDRIVGVTTGNPAGEALLRFMQRKALTEVYKLKPAVMAELIRTFGPMDWRLVDAHSLYWVQQALLAGEETLSTFTNDKTNTARLIFFSLRNLFARNHLVFEPFYEDVNYSYLNFTPDLNFIEPLHQAYLTYGPLIDPRPEGGGAGSTYKVGHISFLSEAIRLLYFYGREAEAARYYRYMQDTYGRNEDGTLNAAYTKTLRDFVIDSILEADLDWRGTRDRIAGVLYQALSALSQGDYAGYARLIQTGRALHVQFHQGDSPPADKMKMPPYPEMVSDVLRFWLSEPASSPYSTMNKARLWLYLPTELKQEVYDPALPLLKRECDLSGFDVDKAFPEPEGMEAYRKDAGRRAEEKKKRGIETPQQSNY